MISYIVTILHEHLGIQDEISLLLFSWDLKDHDLLISKKADPYRELLIIIHNIL
jgi:hypothetical protein